MKAMQKVVGRLIVGCLFACCLTSNIQAQTTTRVVQSVTVSDMDVMLQAVEMTTPQAAESVPKSGTFYSAQFPNWPPLPCNINNVPVWNLGGGVFLLSDLDVNYSQRPMASSLMTGNMMAMDAPMPGDGSGADGGTNSYTSNGSSYLLPDYGTNLWIANFALSSNNAVGMVSNTAADISYEIQTRQSLTSTDDWASAGFVYGSELTNWTAFSMAAFSPTNNLFLRIRSWADDGSGLPIWWQMQYFGYTGVDPYGDPAGDGWNNLQKFQNGMNPNVFYTPPAPQGVTVSYNANNNTAAVSWQPSLGSVTGYTVTRNNNGSVTDFNFSANATTFTDTTQAQTPNPYDPFAGPVSYNPTYQVQAHYTGGDSAWSDPVPLLSLQNAVAFNVVPGAQGSEDLVVSALPQNVVALQITRFGPNPGGFNPYCPVTNFNIAVSSLTNGIYVFSDTNLYYPNFYYWWAQTVDENGCLSDATYDFPGMPVEPFYDGRAQLKQNLIFLLRSATVDYPFQFVEYDTNSLLKNPAIFA